MHVEDKLDLLLSCENQIVRHAVVLWQSVT